MSFDLVVRNGRVVTAASEGFYDIGIEGGRIAELGADLGPAEEVVDAAGKLVIPGGIDAHVHFTPVNLPDRSLAWADDFVSGTKAAAAGGITTIGDITFSKLGEGLIDTIERVAADSESKALIDFMLHPVLLDPSPERLAEIERLPDLGVASLKMFMQMGQFDAKAQDYLEALRLAGGSELLTLIHCEDGAIIGNCTHHLVLAGDSDISHFPETRPVLSESSAVERAIAFADTAGAPIYIVHLSSQLALEAVSRAKARGQAVYVETRPIYLTFTRERFDGPEPGIYVGNPPLREDFDVEALWAGLASGQISTCCTDHAPWRKADKLAPEVNVENTRPGMADLETLMPSLFSNGVRSGRISLQKFVEITSTNAARLFQLYPNKGTIVVGGDADLTIIDPELTKTVHSEDLETNAKFSLLDGESLTGWPIMTISRGQIVAEDSRALPVGPRGLHVKRGPARDDDSISAAGRTRPTEKGTV
jgi:dihydropyrimidinase